MSVVEQAQLLTIGEFIRLYDQEGPFELIDGERKPLMPPVALHVWTVRILFRLLDEFCRTRNSGEVLFEMTYVLVYNAQWVKGSRQPDLIFIAANRWQQYITEVPDWYRKPLINMPDLAVEVVSPNDLYTEIQDKVDRYRSDGVRLIWVIDPQRSRVNVYAGDHFTTLDKTDTLEGGDVIPGFSLKLENLFISNVEGSQATGE